jgi:N-acetylglucosamine-6-phosphate deacetylase
LRPSDAGYVSDVITVPGRVLGTDGALRDGVVEVAGGRIADVRAEPLADDARGALVVPGFVDLHVHGGAGAEFPTAGEDGLHDLLAVHARHGTTGLLATTVSAPPGPLRDAVASLARAASVAGGAELLGIHLEGPFLSDARRGAQDPRALRPPDPREIDALLAAGGGAVRLVTLAPELPGGLAAIEQLVAAGVVAALGHSDATYEQGRAAITAGARHATHLFNGMRPLHHREPGLAGAALEAPDVVCELIADGHHVHPAALRLAHAAKGTAGVALVTDAMQAAGLGDGRYRLGRLAVRVRDGRAELADTGTLAGSTLTMDAAVRHAVEAMGVPLADAVAMASVVPVRVLGLDDRKGAIAVGFDADLVVLDDRLEVRRVMVGGRWV